jgi:hypothetical protein
MRLMIACLSCLLCCFMSSGVQAESPAERGYYALTQKSFVKPLWTLQAFNNVWKQWGLKEQPADFLDQLRVRYGLHQAPYENAKLPMGLRSENLFLFSGITIDCMICHGGSIFGKSYVGLGNTSLELHALFEEMAKSGGLNAKLPIQFSRVRGTNEAGATAVYLMGYRNENLGVKAKFTNLGLFDDLCEDVPAWWHLKKKKSMYYTGGADAHSVRSKMQFMMSPLNPLAAFEAAEKDFQDIDAYLRTIEAPKYPLSINLTLAKQGELIFSQSCASCHGTYGEKETYPNKIIALEKIGTDRRRYDGITEAFGRHYNKTWFAKETPGWFFDDYTFRASEGYQAPPLDGIWATAPYLHNGSVPTLEDLLNSSQRPKLFTRSYKTDLADYNPVKVGWKVDELKEMPKFVNPIEWRKIYDTTKSGRGNQGHTFGDALTDEERKALIEYLKTL